MTKWSRPYCLAQGFGTKKWEIPVFRWFYSILGGSKNSDFSDLLNGIVASQKSSKLGHFWTTFSSFFDHFSGISGFLPIFRVLTTSVTEQWANHLCDRRFLTRKMELFHHFRGVKMSDQKRGPFRKKVVTSSHRSRFWQKWIRKGDPKTARKHGFNENMEITGFRGLTRHQWGLEGGFDENNRLFYPKTPNKLS